MICVGKNREGYIFIHSDFIVPLFSKSLNYKGVDYSFNEKKFNDFMKTYRKVFTVVGPIYDNERNILGYVVSDDKGHIDVLKEDKLKALLKNSPCMNYSLSQNGDTVFIRKNPSAPILEFTEKQINDRLNYYFSGDKSNTTLKNVQEIMKENGFKIGWDDIKISSGMKRQNNTRDLLYYNNKGIQVFLHFENDILILEGKSKVFYATLEGKEGKEQRVTTITFPKNSQQTIQSILDFLKQEELRYSMPLPYKVYSYSAWEDLLILPNKYKRKLSNLNKIDLHLGADKNKNGKLYEYTKYIAENCAGYLIMQGYTPELKSFYSEYEKKMLETMVIVYNKRGFDKKDIQTIMNTVRQLIYAI